MIFVENIVAGFRFDIEIGIFRDILLSVPAQDTVPIEITIGLCRMLIAVVDFFLPALVELGCTIRDPTR